MVDFLFKEIYGSLNINEFPGQQPASVKTVDTNWLESIEGAWATFLITVERCDLSVRGQSQSKGGESAKSYEGEQEKTGISTKGDD